MNDLLAPPLFELVTSPDVDGEHEGRARFDVRSFVATEAISTLFKVKVTAHHVEPGLDFLEIVGAPASFRATGHGGGGLPLARTWSGVVSHMEQTRAVAGERDKAYSTYELTLVPRLWLLTQRRNYRIFQFKSELAIALEILAEWEITVDVRLDPKTYRGRKYKVQYAETDYEFVYRILSEVGICFFFEHKDDESVVVLTDAPHLAPRIGAIGFQDTPSQAEGSTFVTSVRRSARIRPNAILLRDRDYRKDSTYELQAGAHVVDVQKRELAAFDRRLEGFYYPENFNFLDDGVDETSPTADSKGLSRTDEKEARRLAMIDLGSRRNDAYVVELESNDLRLSHGVTFLVEGHPADEINGQEGHLVVESRIGGRIDSAIHISVEAVSARRAYHATLAPKPRIIGLESATVVGAAGEEIDCDEFGRVKVHFHWDRYSKRNDDSSCWIPVSQTWGGAGMGGGQIPRIGHEVLVEFLAGDPDRPIITGRVFTAVNKIPLKLPACKTQTILQSQSTCGTGGSNMIRMEDSAGNEHLDMRAQKDMNLTVLNNRASTINGGETRHVGKCRIKTVGETDSLTAGAHIVLTAGAKGAADIVMSASQNVSVAAKQSISLSAENDSISATAKKAISMYATEDVTITGATKSVMLVCGASFLLLTPKGAILQAEKTYLNPGLGEGDIYAILQGGPLPPTKAEADEIARVNAEKEKLAKEKENYEQNTIPGKHDKHNREKQDLEDMRESDDVSRDQLRQAEREMKDPNNNPSN